jgi:5-methylcytosine-specific restriction endonuclease McrA
MSSQRDFFGFHKLSYEEQLQTSDWREKRARIIQRDSYRCVKCLSKKSLEVHHMYYTEGRMAWDYPDSALITLCGACHQEEHNKKQGKLKASEFDEALERLVVVAKGVRSWCYRQYPKELNEEQENGEKTD